MKKAIFLFIGSILVACSVLAIGVNVISGSLTDSMVMPGQTKSQKRIYIRTETYPRPPYSGATYYIYERDEKVICTKLEVCNKYENCDTVYRKGVFKDEVDLETGDPYGQTKPVVIAPSKLKRHVCLTKFKLIR